MVRHLQMHELMQQGIDQSRIFYELLRIILPAYAELDLNGPPIDKWVQALEALVTGKEFFHDGDTPTPALRDRRAERSGFLEQRARFAFALETGKAEFLDPAEG